jgi:hypothetical protein
MLFMTPERWQRIDSLLEEALERKPNERPAPNHGVIIPSPISRDNLLDSMSAAEGPQSYPTEKPFKTRYALPRFRQIS